MRAAAAYYSQLYSYSASWPVLLAGQQVINWIVLLVVAHKQRLYRQRFVGLGLGSGWLASVFTRR